MKLHSVQYYRIAKDALKYLPDTLDYLNKVKFNLEEHSNNLFINELIQFITATEANLIKQLEVANKAVKSKGLINE